MSYAYDDQRQGRGGPDKRAVEVIKEGSSMERGAAAMMAATVEAGMRTRGGEI